jgi:hypothetical protein
MNNIGCTSPAQVTAILHQMRALGSNSLDHEGWLEYIRILRSILAGEWEDLDVAYDWLNINVPYLPAMQEFHDMLLEELIEGRVRTLPPALSRVYPWSDIARDLADSFIELADCREKAIDLDKDEMVPVSAPISSARRSCLKLRRMPRVAVDPCRGRLVVMTTDLRSCLNECQSTKRPN